MGDVKRLVDVKIAGKRVVVFSKASCPYCAMAKEVLQPYIGRELDPEEYEVVEIGNRPDCNAIQDYLAKLTGARTVPRVFIKGKCVGGGTEVQTLDKKGKLPQLLS